MIYFIFHQDGSLAFTCNSLKGFTADIADRNLIAIESGIEFDLDYTYTLEDGTITREHTPQSAPP